MEDDSRIAIEKALETIAGGEDQSFISAVRSIIYANHRVGRLDKFLRNGSADSIDDYVRRVVTYYREWHDRVRRLCREQDHDLWESYYDMLKRWAYAFLQRKSFPAHGDRARHAADVASSAAGLILKTRFPYDVHFDRWAYHVLQIACLRHIEKVWNPTSLPDDQTLALEAWLESVRDPAIADQQRRTELRIDLLRAMERLHSDARQRFIWLYYFEQRSFEEIGTLMGKRVNALYKLHSDALQELRKILAGNQDKYE